MKKVPGGFSRPFLSTELEGAAKPAIAARESFLRKVEGEMPEVASMRRIDDAIGDLPEKECENTPAFSSAVGMGKSVYFDRGVTAGCYRFGNIESEILE